MTKRKPWNIKEGVYERDADGHHAYPPGTFKTARKAAGSLRGVKCVE